MAWQGGRSIPMSLASLLPHVRMRLERFMVNMGVLLATSGTVNVMKKALRDGW